MSAAGDDSYRPLMDTLVPRWVRIGLVALLAGPQLVIGLWAMAAPRNWFDSFPGLGPALVAGEPPFNRHLATDVGAGFFAVGVGLAFAAHWGTRRVVKLSLAVLVAFTVPHVVYHAIHPATGLSSVADVANVAVLASGIGWAALLWWGANRTEEPVDAPRDREPEHALH